MHTSLILSSYSLHPLPFYTHFATPSVNFPTITQLQYKRLESAIMSDNKIIAVIGATGAQGGSVINAILNDSSSNFSVRAITRDSTKPNALKLKERGCEVVEADLSNKDFLQKAFEGAYGVFGVTDFWATMNPDIEISQGKNVADAAKVHLSSNTVLVIPSLTQTSPDKFTIALTSPIQAAGVKHLVFSSLINVSKASNGKLTRVTHFDSKAKIAEYIQSIGIPASFFMPGFYMSNLLGMIQSGGNGELNLMLPISPESKVPVFDTRGDTGKYVLAILTKGLTDKKVFHKEYPAAVKYLTPKEIVETVAGHKGVKGHFIQVPEDAFIKALEDKGMPHHAADDMTANMLLMNKDEVGYFGGMDVEAPQKELGVRPRSFEDWVKAEWN